MNHRGMNGSYLVAILICFFVSLVWYFEGNKSEDNFTVSVELILPSSAEYVELFYDDGSGYAAGKSIVRYVVAGVETYNFTLSKGLGIQRVRLDPGNTSGNVELRSLGFYSRDGEVLYSGQLLHEKLRLLNQIEYSGFNEEVLSYIATGSDPFLDLEVPLLILEEDSYGPIFATLALFFGLSILSIVFLWFIGRPEIKKYFNKLFLCLDKFFEDKVNQSELIVFNRLSILLVFIMFVLAVGLIAFKINQSSIAMYDAYLPSDVKSKVLVGTPRAIRSDEWVVQTPYVLSQVINDNPAENLSIGPGATTALTAVPVAGLINLMQPKFWGFLLLDLERGFSWYWTYKSIGLLLTGFLFFMLITRSNPLVSVIGALAVYSSNFSQWWFSSNYPEIVIAFFGIVISSSYLMFSRNKYLVALSAIAFSVFSVNFLLHLYPPFLVPLFYLGLFTVIGFLFSEKRYMQTLNFFRFRLVVTCCGMLAVTAFSAYWYITAADTIDVIRNTAYPGGRFTTGGGETWRIFTGYFDLFSFDDRRFPAFLGNVCEASRFFMFAPLVMLFFLFKTSRKSLYNPLIISLLVYIGLLIVWSTVGFPRAISAYSLWSTSDPNRATLGLGVANVMLFCVVLATLLKDEVKPVSIFVTAGVSLIFCSILAYYGVSISEADPEYYTNKRIAISAVIMCILVFSLLRLNLKLILGLFILMSIPGFRVNPVVVGLDSFYGKEVAKVAGGFNESRPGRWAVFGTIVHPQYFKALGMNVFNGTRFTPDAGEMSLLDVREQYKNIWNRYAHIHMEVNLEIDSPSFALKQADLYTITIDPCAEEMHMLGIVYLVFTYNAEAQVSSCANSLTPNPINGLYIYEMRPYKFKDGIDE